MLGVVSARCTPVLPAYHDISGRSMGSTTPLTPGHHLAAELFGIEQESEHVQSHSAKGLSAPSPAQNVVCTSCSASLGALNIVSIPPVSESSQNESVLRLF